MPLLLMSGPGQRTVLCPKRLKWRNLGWSLINLWLLILCNMSIRVSLMHGSWVAGIQNEVWLRVSRWDHSRGRIFESHAGRDQKSILFPDISFAWILQEASSAFNPWETRHLLSLIGLQPCTANSGAASIGRRRQQLLSYKLWASVEKDWSHQSQMNWRALSRS